MLDLTAETSMTKQIDRRLPGIGYLFNIFLDSVFPHKCLACRCFFQPSYQNRKGSSEPAPDTGIQPKSEINKPFNPFVCPDCRHGILHSVPPICRRCGVSFHSREGENHLCEACITLPGNFRMARAPFIYERTLVNLIHRFKYDGKTQLAKPFREFLFTMLVRSWNIEDIDMILPVPLHRRRFRARGFNQSFLLAQFMKPEKVNKAENIDNIPIEKDILLRIRQTKPQTELRRNDRFANIRNAFDIRHHERIIGKRILLVDDVLTTGATVDECARLLLRHGVEQVDVLTLARAV